MGFRDRIRRMKEHIANSRGSARLRGDYAKIKQYAKEQRERQELRAEERVVQQRTQTKRLKAETSLINAQTANERAKRNRRQLQGGRMSGPFDKPPMARNDIFSQVSRNPRGGQLPGEVSGFGDLPGARKRKASRRGRSIY